LPKEKGRLVAFDHKVFRRADWFDPDDWDSYESYWMVVNDRKVGCCAFERNVDFGLDPDKDSGPRRGSLYIASTGILPQHQGRGLGVRFKRWQIAWARRHGFTRIVTNCRRSNRTIIRLNEKLGFKILQTTIGNYYHRPPEPAVVMELRLSTPQVAPTLRIRWAEDRSRRVISSALMPTEQIVALLIAERNRLDAAVQALQGPVKRRGRPPGSKVSAPVVSGRATVKRKRRLSAAGRKAIVEATRRRRAAVKASKAPSPPVVERKRRLSAAARKAMADAAKKRWAAIKAGKAPNPFAKTKRKIAEKG
jgi:GNAT superfamily N-acetyltransferase